MAARRKAPAARARRRSAALAVGLGVAPAAVVVLLAACLPTTPPQAAEPAEPPLPPVSSRWAVAPPPAVAVAGANPSRAAAVDLVDGAWADEVAAATGIPRRAVIAYAAADLTVAHEQPSCDIAWNTLAGIGWVESRHGSYGGATLTKRGLVAPRILGPRLTGDGVAAIEDTDGGALDGDDQWDRAVGPLQFIPETWRRWGADGDADGVRDPNNIDDAALAAARYLCRSGPLGTERAWRDAVFTYNPLTRYINDVATRANEYAQRVELG
ncbi:lytic transglycosylase domain-containing protein [Microbacterium sp. 77mftsu3.1]|uniref:lytic transglycosylase domain-containing protein n=1 Tax=Microbacterium sp. 77mftsu3.1 TaxID=1761802 RepID=UPI0003728FF9|nr:lytic murein transglycosylase [Microbacterium sp. 77mftsu3.1]SDH15628.1 Membrane-bound lytic murein transglycosylase B [Microbacterium sp. 77mftsu3.1]